MADLIQASAITCLFLDIGGVLLTNGWDRHTREQAAAAFQLELTEMEERHHLTVDTYEQGKLTLDQYLELVIFHQKRPFTKAQFRRYMFDQSKPYGDMIAMIARLRAQYGLKVAVVSNEGRELNEYRVREFQLNRIVDFFLCSASVHLRKPDADIFRLALDAAQTPAGQVIYIENTPLFVQIAEGLGIQGIVHTDFGSTCAKLASFGLHDKGAEANAAR